MPILCLERKFIIDGVTDMKIIKSETNDSVER